ncbi:MAG: helix-turn-helix transcriptional regulator, partial [Sulfurimonas sp.]
CIADFILKRYLSASRDSVIDFLYHRLQENISLLHLESHALDALSLYIIEKVRAMTSVESMDSLRCEHAILEFLIHRFALIDIHQDSLSDDEICITKSAKEILLKSFVNPPTIEVLAHLCATNETKLKSAFKKRYKTTIYNYIQKLRLQKANLLLREQSSTIGAVAKEVGYKHQGHFSKLFFEYYGVYPKDLLKK